MADVLLAPVGKPGAARDVEVAEMAASQEQHTGIRDAVTVHDVQHGQLPQPRQGLQSCVRHLLPRTVRSQLSLRRRMVSA